MAEPREVEAPTPSTPPRSTPLWARPGRLWFLVLFALLVNYLVVASWESDPRSPIAYTAFVHEVEAGNVERVSRP
jgi:hypothetical protein